MLAAFQNRNYRLYFAGQVISFSGTWMQQIALSWLTYSLTRSEFLLGFTAFASQIPAFVVTPFAGAIADRMNRHKLIVITQIFAMIQALSLAYFTLTHHINVTGIIILGIAAGIISAFELPTRQAFVLEIVEDPKLLNNAIALNSTLINSTRLIGPAIAGFLIAGFGEGMCFLINGLSYMAVIIALLMMRVTPRQQAAHKAPLLQHIGEGFQYAFGFAPIRSLIIYMSILSISGMAYGVLMPAFVHNVLHGTAQTQGSLMGAAAVGALISGIVLANRKTVLGLGNWILYSSAIFSFGLIAFALSSSFIFSMMSLAFIGFGMMLQMGSMNTILQTLLDEDKRGRVMSIYVLAFTGMAPIGSLLAGLSGQHLGIRSTLLLSGGACALAAIWLARQMPKLREAARPVYIAKGIIDEIPAPIVDEDPA